MTAFGKELTELEKHCKFHNRRYPLLAGHVLARILQDAKRGKSVNEDSPVCDDVIRSLAFATVIISSFFFKKKMKLSDCYLARRARMERRLHQVSKSIFR